MAERDLRRDLDHFRAMADTCDDVDERALWARLADEVQEYLDEPEQDGLWSS